MNTISVEGIVAGQRNDALNFDMRTFGCVYPFRYLCRATDVR
jgi:hypothetical protein